MKYITGLFRYHHVSLQYGYSGTSDALSLCTRKSSCKAWDVLYIRKTCSILDCSIQFRMLWRLLNSPVTSWKKEAYPNVVTGPNFMNFTDKTAIHKFRNRMQKVARISICVLWAISTIISGDIDFWCQIWSKLLKFTGRLFSVVFLGYYYLAQIAQTKELIYHINLQKQNRYQNRTDHPNVEQQLAVSAINKGDFASTQIDHLIALKLQKEKEESIYLLAWPGVGFGCLGQVAEDESKAVFREEQVRRELGPRRFLLPLLLVAFLRLHSPVRRYRRGLGRLYLVVGSEAARERWGQSLDQWRTSVPSWMAMGSMEWLSLVGSTSHLLRGSAAVRVVGGGTGPQYLTPKPRHGRTRQSRRRGWRLRGSLPPWEEGADAAGGEPPESRDSQQMWKLLRLIMHSTKDAAQATQKIGNAYRGSELKPAHTKKR